MQILNILALKIILAKPTVAQIFGYIKNSLVDNFFHIFPPTNRPNNQPIETCFLGVPGNVVL